MKAIDYEKIRVKGFEIKSITSLKISNKINEHGYIYLSGILAENCEDKYIELSECSKKITIYIDNENKMLFNGIVTNIEINVLADLYTINIEGKSLSYLMDITKISRSFQDISITYNELISKIFENYNINYLLNINDEPINELIVQYEETDFEFIKRIISKFNLGIFIDICKEINSIYIGTPENIKTIKNKITDYEIIKDLKTFDYMKNNYLSDAKEIDYIIYKINSFELLNLGDNIQFLEQKFYVYSAVYEIKDSLLVNSYELKVKNGLRVKNLYNEKICGSSINGKIISVSKEKVQIHLDIDNNQDKSKAYWFKFSTMSANTDGSGWYCMPEIDDSVRIYFPSKEEKDSFAVSAVSDYVAEEGIEDLMGNPDDKYLKTANDKLVKLTPNGVLLSCNNGQADVKFNIDGSVSIISKNDVSIIAEDSVNITSDQNIKFTAEEEIYFGTDIGAALKFDSEGQIKEMGSEVKNN